MKKHHTETGPRIKPLHDRVLIKEDTESAEQKTSFGMIIPASAQGDKGGKKGLVVAVGAGRTENGKLIPLSVKVGDTVLFQWGDKITDGNTEYYVVRESEILALIK